MSLAGKRLSPEVSVSRRQADSRHSETQQLRTAVVGDELGVSSPIHKGTEQVVRLIRAKVEREGVDDLFAGDRAARPFDHLDQVSKGGKVLQDLSEHLLPFAEARLEDLVAQFRKPQSPALDEHEA